MGTIHDFELGKLMYSERFSDMTLVCDGHEFKVHKVVVCSQSPVLAAAVTGSFKVLILQSRNADKALMSDPGSQNGCCEHRRI